MYMRETLQFMLAPFVPDASIFHRSGLRISSNGGIIRARSPGTQGKNVLFLDIRSFRLLWRVT